MPVVLALTPLVRALGRNRRPVPAQLPKVLGMRSGGVTRCQIRELTPNVVSIDFQRRNLLTKPVSCPDLATLGGSGDV